MAQASRTNARRTILGINIGGLLGCRWSTSADRPSVASVTAGTALMLHPRLALRHVKTGAPRWSTRSHIAHGECRQSGSWTPFADRLRQCCFARSSTLPSKRPLQRQPHRRGQRTRLLGYIRRGRCAAASAARWSLREFARVAERDGRSVTHDCLLVLSGDGLEPRLDCRPTGARFFQSAEEASRIHTPLAAAVKAMLSGIPDRTRRPSYAVVRTSGAGRCATTAYVSGTAATPSTRPSQPRLPRTAGYGPSTSDAPCGQLRPTPLPTR